MSSKPSRSLGELAALVGGELIGAAVDITGVATLEAAGPSELSFFGNARYRAAYERTRAGAVLIDPEATPRAGSACVRVKNPHLAFARISAVFHPPPTFEPGVVVGAHVHPGAQVHPRATVMAGATVERGAQVGEGAVLFPGVFVGQDAVVGADCRLFSNVTVGARCTLGARVVVHPSTVIGADGFGFAFDPERLEHVKIPQAGTVRIEDDVELGACVCIDRGTTGETVIGRGTKVDNLVQVAHNVRVGPLSLICAQAGVSGSAEIGTGVVLAGQVGVVGHIRVGDMAKVGAQSGVAQDVPDGTVVSGSPAVEHRTWLRNTAVQGRLAELAREVHRLQRRLAAWEKEES